MGKNEPPRALWPHDVSPREHAPQGNDVPSLSKGECASLSGISVWEKISIKTK